MAKRVPFVAQMEVAECGAACLAMVLGYHGYDVSVDEAREACRTSAHGVSAFSIVRAAEQYGFRVRAYRLSAGELQSLATATILHFRRKHFVVLERFGSRGVKIVDPAAGRQLLTHAEFEESFSGIALAFEPGPRSSPRRRLRRQRWRRLLRILFAGTGNALPMLVAGGLLYELIALAYPASSQVLIDAIIVPQREGALATVFLIVCSGAIIKMMLVWVRERVSQTMMLKLDVARRRELVEHLMGLPCDYVGRRAVGDLLERVNAAGALREASSLAVTLILDLVLLVTYSALLLTYHAGLATLIIIGSIGRIAVAALIAVRARDSSNAEIVAHARETGAAVEAFAAGENAHAFATAAYLERRYVQRLRHRLSSGLTRRRFIDLLLPTNAIADGAMRGAITLWAGTLVLRDEVSLGVFSALLMMQAILTRPLASLVEASGRIVVTRQRMNWVGDLLECPKEQEGSAPFSRGQPEIRLDAVTYRYGPDLPLILDGLTMSVPSGKMVAVVGRAGAGKSTLVRIITGLLPPTNGRILVGGVDLRAIDRGEYRRQIGVVLQGAILFNDTVHANVDALGRGLSRSDVEDACRLACIDDVVRQLPAGYDTIIGERGRLLSGGQRQRLCLARALASKPSLLVLDEATSALDKETEIAVYRNLRSLHCTIICIGHSPTAASQVDEVMFLDRGRVAARGSFEALLKRGVIQSESSEVVASASSTSCSIAP